MRSRKRDVGRDGRTERFCTCVRKLGRVASDDGAGGHAGGSVLAERHAERIRRSARFTATDSGGRHARRLRRSVGHRVALRVSRSLVSEGDPRCR
jgi:hypothetical protein